MRKPLKQAAIEVLQEHVGQWPKIAEDTKLNYQWMRALAYGRIQDPGAAKLEKLISWRPKK